MFEEESLLHSGAPRSSGTRVVAVLLAGGIGSRVGHSTPKQLLKVAGKPIMMHTLEVFAASPRIDEVLIMMNPGVIAELDFLREHNLPIPVRVLPGGATRNETTQLALAAIEGDETKVLFHDAVRPFVDHRIIDECIDALDRFDAVDTAIPSADTIVEIDVDGCIAAMPTRGVLRRGQTPQAFRTEVLKSAYEVANLDPDFAATDDCGVVFNYLPDVKIHVVEGTPENMKITDPIDLHIADKLFQLQSATLSHSVDDLPCFVGKNIVVFGGAYGIGQSIVELARAAGATVHSFSRSETGTDVTSRKAVRSALASVRECGQQIDHVVVTAGVLNISDLNDAPRKHINGTVKTNLIAPAIIAKEVHADLRASGGSLVLFTSSSYTRGRAGYSMYSATKAGVVNLTQALAEEWEDDGVRVNSINPQRTDTPMRKAAFGMEPPHSLLTPEAVAAVSLRTMASEITGQTVSVRI
ncbi:bifunctional cytidylyltransferase/SDR family oxidoreductase [Leucobacter sp. CX42]|uniref:bifunctional cytidylyltransferase/SDR family oxidoreductase n=1 Tax=unclassified Leucobacter TaxID=2621730 RepID=UPI00334283C2